MNTSAAALLLPILTTRELQQAIARLQPSPILAVNVARYARVLALRAELARRIGRR